MPLSLEHFIWDTHDNQLKFNIIYKSKIIGYIFYIFYRIIISFFVWEFSLKDMDDFNAFLKFSLIKFNPLHRHMKDIVHRKTNII